MTAATRVVAPHPCAKCPFLAKFKGDADYLRPGRRTGIVRSVLEGANFPCHETTVADDEGSDRYETAESLPCAGLTLVMLRDNRNPPGTLKIAERLGAFDAEAFLDANTHVETWDYHEAAFERDLDEGFEPCNTVGPDCLAPAGWMIGGDVVSGEESADQICPSCGEPVCSECADDTNGMCGSCQEYEDAD